ncbi:MAG: hypothetical protein V4700_05595 [Pseudomonadota bacterium]
MPYQSIIKTSFLSILIATASVSTSVSYAAPDPILDGDIGKLLTSTQGLVAGFGSTAISKKLMNTEPTNNTVTMATDTAQATYLNPANSLFVGKLTRALLSKTNNLGKDNDNDNDSFTWNPNTKADPKLEKEPLKSVDINSLLEPIVYNDVEKAQANNVIDSLSNALNPLDTINFNKLVASLSGNKKNNIKAKLNEKQTQAYLAALRSYAATQTVALSNLYQLYNERQAIDPNTLPSDLKKAVNAVASQTKGPVSTLQLENFMTTRRILDKDWNLNLTKENPATLQREQVQLMAENLAETYQTRMTLERLLATMSVLVLEFNQQIRIPLQIQIQNISNPPKKK